MIVILSRPFRCVKCIGSLFKMIVTVDDEIAISFSLSLSNRTMIIQVIDSHFSLEPVPGICYLPFVLNFPNISNPNVFPVVPRICANTSLYLGYAAKGNKTKCIINPFFINIQRLLWLYSIMCEKPCAFIWASVSNWSELVLINC